jgi:hypothetical protein
MKHIENIVIGQPLVPAHSLFSSSTEDWINNEEEKTFWTRERFLPRILVDLGFFPSTSEVKRNKPELFINLNDLDFLEIQVSKKKKVWILVGI